MFDPVYDNIQNGIIPHEFLTSDIRTASVETNISACIQNCISKACAKCLLKYSRFVGVCTCKRLRNARARIVTLKKKKKRSRFSL